MANDKYKLKAKSDADLHTWWMQQSPGTDEYHAGEEESMRRVAILEEVMEKAEEPSRKREMFAVAVAIATLAIIIITIMVSY